MIAELLNRLIGRRSEPPTSSQNTEPVSDEVVTPAIEPVIALTSTALTAAQSETSPPPRAATLNATAVARIAQRLGIDPAAVWAVAQVESGGKGGFLPDKRPRILFEAHIFSRLTGRRFDSSHPTLSRPRWDRKLYRGGAREYERLEAAKELDEDAALQSCSWGKFQILGTNHGICGYPTIHAFVEAMRRSEEEHLDAFMNFVRYRRLDDELREHRWADFAFGYNGTRFKENRYDTKLELAYQAAKRMAFV